jgi:putative FmdB family regulatory protein
MPIYEYQCENCNRRFEVMQRMTEPVLATCEKCGGHVRRLISQTSFVLKGGGWYVTDYPSESRKKAMSQEKSSGDSKSGDSKSGDSKSTETSTASTTTEKVSSTESKT